MSVQYKRRSVFQLIIKAALQWFKIALIILTVISIAAYILSGNFLYFYDFGILFYIGGLPYVIFFLMHRRRTSNV